MKVTKVLNTKAGAVFVGVVAVSTLAYFTAKKATETVGEVGQAINPLNNDNVFASGVNAVGESITGQKHWTLGGWLYEVINGTSAEQIQRAEEKNLIEKLYNGG